MQEQASQNQAGAKASTDTLAPRILIAEDDLDFRTLLASALRRDGYRVIDVDAGLPLLRVLERSLDWGEEGPALVISDERMPGMRGLEAFRRARDQGWTSPLVLITAFGNDEVMSEAADAGAIVIHKPFDIDDLRTVARFLATPGTRRETSRPCRVCGRPACAKWLSDSIVLVLCMRCREVRGFRL